MSKNIKTPMVVTETSNLMIDLIKFLFLGEYTCRDYEYTFYLNGEEFKADECFSNFYGRSYCEYNGVTYNNVEYTKVLINEYKENSFIVPVFTYFCLFIFIVNVILNLFFNGYRGDFLDV